MEQVNLRKIEEMISSQRDLQHEIHSLARLIGETRFADVRLVLPMSRRVSKTFGKLNALEAEMITAKERQNRFYNTKEILQVRIRNGDRQQAEDELSDHVVAACAQRIGVQPATRKLT